MLALHRTALPERVGIDWSFGDWREYLGRIRQQNRELEEGRVFVELVRLLDTFASYDGIAAKALRVCPTGAPSSAPQNWPTLIDTDLARAHVVEVKA